MALRRRQSFPRTARPSSLTAAGRKIDLSSQRDMKGISQRPYPWQKRAYNFYDPMSPTAIGEVWFAGRYIAESLSRVRLVAAVQLEADDDPVALTDANLDSMSPTDRPDDTTVMLLRAAVGRLTNTHGGQADIMRGAALNNFLAGESWLIGQTIDGQEEWEIHSVEAIEVVEPATRDRDAVLALKSMPDDKREDWLPLDDASLARIWRRHPRFPELPDAAMGAALTYCEDLWSLTQMIRAAARSRMPSGILKYPSTQAAVTDTEGDDDSGDPPTDPFMDSLIKHFSEPIKDPNDAAAMVPFLLRMDPEDLAHVDKIDFAREIDRLAVELRRESRESFAATIDLPADVLTGKQGLNDWSAWNVDEETFRVHLAPHTELICDGLTAGYFWPTLTGVEDHRRYRIWYDAGNLIVHPNRSTDADTAHERLTISDAAYRGIKGFDETMKPDDAEVARRVEIERARAGGAPAESQPPGGAENGPPTPTGPTEEAQGLTASAAVPSRDVRDSLGYRLAQIERALMDRLLTAADADLRRALTRAGNRVASAARKRTTPQQIREIVAAHSQEQVCAHLGESLLASLSLTSDDVLDGAFDDLAARWDAWVRRAQDEAIRLIDQYGAGLSAETVERMQQTNTANREAGWLALRDALVATSTKVLFGKDEPTALGERDPSILVPPRALRRALAIAGGAYALADSVVAAGVLEALEEAERTGGTITLETAATEPPTQGLFSGDPVREALAESGIATVGYVWVYGDPSSRSSSFDPHLALDGQEFAGWDDALLVNDGGWPETDFFYPDDHDGCQCTYAILDAPVDEPVVEEPETIEGFAVEPYQGWRDPDRQIYTYAERDARVEIVGKYAREMTDADRDNLLRGVRRAVDAGDGRTVRFMVDDMPQGFERNSGAAQRGGPMVAIHPDVAISATPRFGPTWVDDLVARGEIAPAARGYTNVEYTVAHEFGHTMDSGVGGRSLLPTDFVSPLNYGRTNSMESFAEGFAEWLLSGGRTANSSVQALARQEGWSL